MSFQFLQINYIVFLIIINIFFFNALITLSSKFAQNADKLNIFMNMKVNKFISGLSFVYAASIILSLVFHNILPCISE